MRSSVSAHTHLLRSCTTVMVALISLGDLPAAAQSISISGNNSEWTGGCVGVNDDPNACATGGTNPKIHSGTAYTNTGGAAGVAIGAMDPANPGGSPIGSAALTMGGTAHVTYAYAGLESGTTGVINVDGVGSRWTTRRIGVIGHKGDGTLNVTNGAIYEQTEDAGDHYLYIGNLASARGAVTVDGVSNGTRSRLASRNRISAALMLQRGTDLLSRC